MDVILESVDIRRAPSLGDPSGVEVSVIVAWYSGDRDARTPDRGDNGDLERRGVCSDGPGRGRLVGGEVPPEWADKAGDLEALPRRNLLAAVTANAREWKEPVDKWVVKTLCHRREM